MRPVKPVLGAVAAELGPALRARSSVPTRRTHALLHRSSLAHAQNVALLAHQQREVDADVIKAQRRDATDESGHEHGGGQCLL